MKDIMTIQPSKADRLVVLIKHLMEQTNRDYYKLQSRLSELEVELGCFNHRRLAEVVGTTLNKLTYIMHIDRLL